MYPQQTAAGTTLTEDLISISPVTGEAFTGVGSSGIPPLSDQHHAKVAILGGVSPYVFMLLL